MLILLMVGIFVKCMLVFEYGFDSEVGFGIVRYPVSDGCSVSFGEVTWEDEG